MKFTHKVKLWGVNEDNTVTLYVENEDGTKMFYRANARLKVLTALDEMEKETELNVLFGIAYVRGKGLTLQIIEVK